MKGGRERGNERWMKSRRQRVKRGKKKKKTRERERERETETETETEFLVLLFHYIFFSNIKRTVCSTVH